MLAFVSLQLLQLVVVWTTATTVLQGCSSFVFSTIQPLHPLRHSAEWSYSWREQSASFHPGMRDSGLSRARQMMGEHSTRVSLLQMLQTTTSGKTSLEDELLWRESFTMGSFPYRSYLFQTDEEYEHFMRDCQEKQTKLNSSNATTTTTTSSPVQVFFGCSRTEAYTDPFWEQILFEARTALLREPEAGPQLYQGILSQPSLLTAIVTVISHDIETELMPATEIKNLFLELLTPSDHSNIRLDLLAVATRNPSFPTAMRAVLFHKGFHALVCYRLGHRLWQRQRIGLAYYMQSTVSRHYSADIHPACRMGHGVYLKAGSGVVIGETATVGNDVSILEGVTLGGTGKEAGDRHPKIGNGVIVEDGAAVLGNIPVGEGAIVQARSIVTKPVPPLGIVSGVPAKLLSYRTLDPAVFAQDDLQDHLARKYLSAWKILEQERLQVKQ